VNAAPKVIEGRYFGDIMAQPQALADTCGWLAAPGRWDDASRFVAARPWRRIVLTGMGSSFHTLHPLNLALVAAGHNPVMMETSELVHYGMALCDEQSLVVAVSQSGSSAETVRLLELNTRATVLGVTNTAGSPLARRAGHVLLAQAGPEHSVSCKTYVSGMLALQWLSAAFTGQDRVATLARLAGASGLVAQYLEEWQARVRALAACLHGIRHLFLTGRGPSLAAAGTGALITKEAARLHAEGMGSAAFRHGPMEMLRNDMMLLVFSGDERTSQLNGALVRELAAQGGRCELVGADATLEALRLPACDPLLLPLLEILPVQMITLALASLDGHEAGHFERATKITDRE
jgi:glucosamine--fructose-6-phosphate aminotransferase (isomerizing)